MTRFIRFAVFLLAGYLVAFSALAAELIIVEKEIDDDHIIIARKNGERLLLEKWSLRFSPLSFEGKAFAANVSPMWVTIYFDDRDPIKWSVEESLGTVSSPPKKPKGTQSPRSVSREVTRLIQAALTLLDYDPGTVDGIAGDKTKATLKAFQKAQNLVADGKANRPTFIALSTRLYQRYPDNQRVLDIATALLNASSKSGGISTPPSEFDVIESYIQGEFEGWEGETVFILDNGQVWQQSSYAYTYHYAYRPKVIIYRTSAGYKMMVEGVSGSIYVNRVK